MARSRARLAVVADPEDVFLRALDDMPASYMTCRQMQHAWEVVDNFRLVDANVETGARVWGRHRKYVLRKLACARCGMRRKDAFRLSSRRGHTTLVKIGSSYDPPPGYGIKGAGNARKIREFLYGAAYETAVFAPPTRKGAS